MILSEEFENELSRVKSLLALYQKLGLQGRGVAMIEEVIKRAERAWLDGNAIETEKYFRELVLCV